MGWAVPVPMRVLVVLVVGVLVVILVAGGVLVMAVPIDPFATVLRPIHHPSVVAVVVGLVQTAWLVVGAVAVLVVGWSCLLL